MQKLATPAGRFYPEKWVVGLVRRFLIGHGTGSQVLREHHEVLVIPENVR